MQKKMLSREQRLARMAIAYRDLLNALAPLMAQNSDIKEGIGEGLRKFLSNVYIRLGDKYDTDYYSEQAARKLAKKDKTGLVFEHVVPKKLFQNDMVRAFMDGHPMTVQDIQSVLDKYWLIATITKAEDALLSAQSMPDDWDHQDVLARYRKAGIPLLTREEFLRLRDSQA